MRKGPLFFNNGDRHLKKEEVGNMANDPVCGMKVNVKKAAWPLAKDVVPSFPQKRESRIA
jgi:hypothetical protein